MNLTDISNDIGELKDTVDNLLGALEIPMPAEFHAKQMKSELKSISYKLRSVYVEMGDNGSVG